MFWMNLRWHESQIEFDMSEEEELFSKEYSSEYFEGVSFDLDEEYNKIDEDEYIPDYEEI
jgi:hypothetical protein